VAYAHAALDRVEVFAAALTRDLARCAALERESMAERRKGSATGNIATEASLPRRSMNEGVSR
jgi:hypothetical protein